MTAYYNDNDPFVAQWLRNLIAAGHLPAGDVDERPIQELSADDLRHATQVHMFAGISGWPLALRLAGWPDDRPVWTGSCPCQPFSAAGRGRGVEDERHLWPEMRRLIGECRPPTIFGEQVAGRAGRDWLAAVRADLEHLGYAVGAADLPAASVGAPHVRQRLFWVADRDHAGLEVVRVEQARAERQAVERGGAAGRMEHSASEQVGISRFSRVAGITDRPWADVEWLPCRDGKARPTQSIVQQMVDGLSVCLGRLRPDQKEEVIHASESSGIGREVLSALRQGYEAAKIWQSLGGRIGFSKATLLFSCLCEHSWELGNIFNGTASRIRDAREGSVREMWQDGSPPRPSHGWQPSQQCAREFADSVHSLSLEFASLNGAAMPLATGIPGRVGRLCALGNAIVPQVAAAFVTAFLQSANR